MKKDIKKLGIPNVCFSLTHGGDYREKKFKKQRKTRGFDDSELWSLRDTIANFIIPRLEEYIPRAERNFIRTKKVNKQIRNLLKAMKLVARDGGSAIYTKKEEKQLTKGLEAFPKIFMRLWL